eukprot:scaffold8214_cov121-Isochrysis_galbana.AAC.17
MHDCYVAGSGSGTTISLGRCSAPRGRALISAPWRSRRLRAPCNALVARSAVRPPRPPLVASAPARSPRNRRSRRRRCARLCVRPARPCVPTFGRHAAFPPPPPPQPRPRRRSGGWRLRPRLPRRGWAQMSWARRG